MVREMQVAGEGAYPVDDTSVTKKSSAPADVDKKNKGILIGIKEVAELS